MEWGAISAWAAAAIALSSAVWTFAREWWMRTEADWALKGELKYPEQKGDWLAATCRLSNFGDGNAHRVTVHLRRAEKYAEQQVEYVPLMRPGDVYEFKFNVHVNQWSEIKVWVTWTPPPIRRRKQRTSADLLLKDHLEPSDLARGRFPDQLGQPR